MTFFHKTNINKCFLLVLVDSGASCSVLRRKNLIHCVIGPGLNSEPSEAVELCRVTGHDIDVHPLT